MYIRHSISEFVLVMVCLDSKKEMRQWKFASSVSRIATDLEMGNWKRVQGGVRIGWRFCLIFLEFDVFSCYDGECVHVPLYIYIYIITHCYYSKIYIIFLYLKSHKVSKFEIHCHVVQ